jgi:hypothetical protein
MKQRCAPQQAGWRAQERLGARLQQHGVDEGRHAPRSQLVGRAAASVHGLRSAQQQCLLRAAQPGAFLLLAWPEQTNWAFPGPPAGQLVEKSSWGSCDQRGEMEVWPVMLSIAVLWNFAFELLVPETLIILNHTNIIHLAFSIAWSAFIWGE